MEKIAIHLVFVSFPDCASHSGLNTILSETYIFIPRLDKLYQHQHSQHPNIINH